MKIGWILSGNKNVAGARIQGYRMIDFLSKRGINSEIIYKPKGYTEELVLTKSQIDRVLKKKYDIIVIHKIHEGKNLFNFVKEAQKLKIKIVYISFDKVNFELAAKSDAFVTMTKGIKQKIPKRYYKKTYLVFDGYEHDKRLYKKHTNKNKIKLVFVSNNIFSKFPQIEYLPKNVSLTIIGPPKKRVEKYYSNKIIFTETPYKFKYLTWKLGTVTKEILKCDVAIIPYPEKHLKLDYIKAKSSNRLIMFMSLGLPTIASPTPEYKNLIKQGKNGFIAKKPKEWIEYIEFLRDNPDKRKEIGLKARKDVINKYSLEKQGKLYLEIFKELFEKKELNFTLFGDVHYNPKQKVPLKGICGKDSTIYFPKFIDKLNKIKQDFIVNLGDLVDSDANSYPLVLKKIKLLKYPIFHLIGNHDLELFPLKKLKKLFGLNRTYYSKEINGYKLIFLNTFDKKASKPDHKNKSRIIGGAISDQQINWLKKELRLTKYKAIIFSHKLLSNQDLKGNLIWEKAPERYTKVENHAEIRKILEKSNKVIGVFQGHVHQNSKVVINKIPYFSIQGFCQSKGFSSKKRASRSFAIVSVKGKKIEVEVKGDRKSFRV